MYTVLDKGVLIDKMLAETAGHVLTVLVKDEKVIKYLAAYADKYSEEQLLQNLLLNAAIVGQP